MRSTPPPTNRSITPGRPKPSSAALGGTAKGFYFRALLRELASQGHHLSPASNYRDFTDYPMDEARALLLECAQRMYPHEPRNEGLRRLGWIIFPTFLSTMVGRVIFGALGNDVHAVLRSASRGFEVSISEGRYEVIELADRGAHVRVRDFRLFPDSFLVGVFEGALAHYGYADAKVTPKPLNPGDFDYHLAW